MFPASSPTQFQFTPLREGRRHSVRESLALKRFQFTPLREGRPFRKPLRYGKANISIHAPPRGATAKNEVLATGKIFQFTPLREGRRGGVAVIPSFRGISIHAPPRGATSATTRCRTLSTFQFTPLREGRQSPAAGKMWLSAYFNSRPSARGDQQCTHTLGLVNLISIHAPPRGATATQSTTSRRSVFQFTPLREGRLPTSITVCLARTFQFTPLREGRRRWRALAAGWLCYFNSRPSARGDPIPRP